MFARRGWSGLDPILRILNDQGAALAEADDLTQHRVGSADSWLENWTAPTDGNYTIEIRDLHPAGRPAMSVCDSGDAERAVLSARSRHRQDAARSGNERASSSFAPIARMVLPARFS